MIKYDENGVPTGLDTGNPQIDAIVNLLAWPVITLGRFFLSILNQIFPK